MRSVRQACRLLSLGLLTFFSLLAMPLSAQPKAEVEKPAPLTVTSIGQATEQISPSSAVLRFGVEIRDPNTVQAVATNRRMTAKIVGAIERQKGIEVSVSPYQMVYVPSLFVPALGTNQPVEFRIQQKGSYKVTTNIEVTVHEMSLIPVIVESALTAGVDRIDAIEYHSSRLNEVADTLLPRAIEDAHAKAQLLAANTGLILGAPIAVTSLQSRLVPLPLASTGNGLGAGFKAPKLTVETEVRVVYEATRSS